MRTVITRRSCGITWDDRRVAACVVRSGLAQFAVERVVVVPRDPAKAVGEDIRSLSEKLEGPVDICVTALPEVDLMYRRVTRPFADRGKIRQTIGPEVESMLPAIDSMPVFDFVLTGTDAEGAHVVQALCARTSRVAALVETLKGSFHDPEIVDCPSVAVAAGAMTLFDLPLDKPVVVIHVGLAETSVAIIEGGGLKSVGAVPLGFERISQGSASAQASEAAPDDVPEHPPQTSYLQDLLREILIMAEKEGVAAAEALVVPAGYASRVSDLERHVRDILGMELHRPSLKDVEYEGDPGAILDELLAVSLACRGVTDADPVNFRQGELGVKMRLGMLMGAAGPWVKAACVLLVLWVAGLVLDVSLKARTSAELDRKIKAEFSTVMPKGTPMVDPVTQMEQHLKRLKAMAGGSRETGAGTPLEVLKDLSAGLPSGMDLTIDTLTMDDQSITISGSTAKYDDVERIQAVLAGLSYVKDVKILSANVDKNDQKVKMRITCRRQV